MQSPDSINVMIDIETLSNQVNAAILTIGAVKFNLNDTTPSSSYDLPDTFYRRVDIQSCFDKGLKQTSETVEWWKLQNTEAKNEAFNREDRHPLETVLSDLKTWLGDKKKVFVWSHGASFDIPILQEAYYRCSIELPWFYYNVRDTRTIYDLAGVNHLDIPPATHNALQDCRRQIFGVLLAHSRLKKED